MELTPLKFTSSPAAVNSKAEQTQAQMLSGRASIPDEIFEIKYEIYGKERVFNLRPLLEIDVTELNELSLANLRIQVEQIDSIRLTLQVAYEQLMENFGLFKLEYEQRIAELLALAREQYWVEQDALYKKWNLAKSALKPPTQDDLHNVMLRTIGSVIDYKTLQAKMIAFQRGVSILKNVGEILMSRSITINKIVESRISKGEPRGYITP